MEIYALNPSQMKTLDECNHDRVANDNTMRIAMAFHSNNSVKTERTMETLWKDLQVTYNLDIENLAYTIQNVDGIMQVVEDES